MNVDWGKAFTVVALVTGFSKKIGLYLMLVKQSSRTLILHATPCKTWASNENTNRDRCFMPDKLEQALMEFFSLNWTDGYIQVYEQPAETLPIVVNCFGCMANVLAFFFYL